MIEKISQPDFKLPRCGFNTINHQAPIHMTKQTLTLRRAGLSVLLFAAAMPGLAQPAGGQIKPFVGAGLTFGGEDLATAEYTDRSSSTVTTGGFLDLRGGIEYRLIQSPWSLQLAIGYHTDSTKASNGEFEFSRVPIELIAMADMSERWRVGLGIRKATGAKVSATGDAARQTAFGRTTTFDSELGVLFQAEYMVGPQFALQARYVSEGYRVQFKQPVNVDGSHLGIFGVFYFQ